MGEVNGDFDGGINSGGEEDERVHEWEAGLPNGDDVTPLNHGLIPPALLSAFNIKPAPCRTAGDVSRASEYTISMIRGQTPTSNFKPFDENKESTGDDEVEDGSDSKKSRRNESPEDADSAAAKTLKRPRLVWTPQLHKRFVEVVAHLGIKNAVPKTIMQLMNVEGLTRENVASHLQKYRLYLKRMQDGGSNSLFDGPSNSTSAGASSEPPPPPPPPAQNGNSNGNVPVPIPMPYGAPPIMPMPMMMGMPHGHGHHMSMGNYGRFDSNHHHYHHQQHQHQQQQQQQQQNQYSNGMMMMQSGNNYGSVMPYHHRHQSPHVAPDKASTFWRSLYSKLPTPSVNNSYCSRAVQGPSVFVTF
ncbi:hypothetical protein Cgig2_004953 [Carnegiea gigantea]|uniref:HTH myb-type domain-containing protein n=1 Tax=Carnegiea gigantea TaxID=171969 RepID=A0A9Q1KZG9_9CARY|nr:hypothetical protein Cgig2_004953 [Carnegiea gigantea]